MLELAQRAANAGLTEMHRECELTEGLCSGRTSRGLENTGTMPRGQRRCFGGDQRRLWRQSFESRGGPTVLEGWVTAWEGLAFVGAGERRGAMGAVEERRLLETLAGLGLSLSLSWGW